MADADEDTPDVPGAAGADGELDEEVQDFRFLSALTSTKSTTTPATLPKRGEKDFEPHGSSAQNDALSGARSAMHDALSHIRTHAPKGHDVVGTLDVNSSMTRIHAVRGQHFRTLGQADRHGNVSLLPEEALYLLERGSLDLRWPVDDAGGDREAEEEGLPLSLQAAYALLIGTQALSLERYQVYANLRRSGYAVFRAPGWYSNDEEDSEGSDLDARSEQRHIEVSRSPLLAYLTSLLSTPRPLGPLLKPGLYRSYDEIYKRLALIPYHDPSTSPHTPKPPFAPLPLSHDTDAEDEENPMRICWHIYKPAPSFKKSNPGAPDFRCAVLDARSASMLDVSDLDILFSGGPPPEQPTAKNMFARLKTGWRSAVLAVVDQGVISYVKVSEAAFGREKVYERQNQGRGGKRGGRGGGRGGRGRGGGRGG